MNFRELPGGDLIEAGLADLQAGLETENALLVSIGASRLRDAGVDVPSSYIRDAEHRLYTLLAQSDSDGAHGRYNALVRRLVSFERAIECAS